MSQPHWLYIATFTHAASKVGTVAAPRRKSRLDEQGPLYATYLKPSTYCGLDQWIRGADTR
jgi:hypothetical protein